MPLLTNEQRAELIREEKERRRLVRICQVRQQADEHARVLRENVRRKRQELLTEVQDDIKKDVDNYVVDLVKRGIIPHTPINSARKSNTSSAGRKTSRSSIKRKAKSSRNRILTREDHERAKERSREAMSRLRETRDQQQRVLLKRLRSRREAVELANQISRHGVNNVLL